MHLPLTLAGCTLCELRYLTPLWGGYGLTGGDGDPEYVNHPSLEWPKRVSAGQRRLLRVPKLSLQERVVGTALFKMDKLQ